MKIKSILSIIVAFLCLLPSLTFAGKWGGTKSRTIVPRDSNKRYQLKIELKYSRDTKFKYNTYIDKLTYNRLETSSSTRKLTKFIEQARKQMMRKKRGYDGADFAAADWEKTVYASLEKIQLKDRYWSKTKTIFAK